MTKLEAIAILGGFKYNPLFNDQQIEAFDMAVSALSAEPCREADDYENEIADLHNRLDIAEYDKERYKEEITTLEAENKGKWIPVGWIPNSKCGYPKPEDEYKHFLTIDNKGEITIQEFLLSLDEEPQPYFTGMRNIVAWQPLPEPYQKGGE